MTALGGILSVVFPAIVHKIVSKCFSFVNKQEKVTQIVLAVVVLVLAVFVPFIIFLILGVMGGLNLAQHSSRMDQSEDLGSKLPPPEGE